MKQFFTSAFSIFIFTCLSAVSSMAQQAGTPPPNENKEYRDLLTKNAIYLGIPRDEISQSFIKDAYKDELTGLTFMYIQQAYGGIKVFNTIISSAFRNDELQTASGKFVTNLAAKVVSSPRIKPVDAALMAARHLKLDDRAALSIVADNFSAQKNYKLNKGGIAKRDIDVTLVYVTTEDRQTVKLAWNVSIDVARSSDWWNVRIDALTGEYIEKNNWTVHEGEDHSKISDLPDGSLPQAAESLEVQAHHPLPNNPVSKMAPPNVTTATYKVLPFPLESPMYGSFSNLTNPWEQAGAGNNAITHGWHFDGANNYNYTRGNNVFATLDRNNTDIPEPENNWADTSTTAAPSLSFLHTLDPGIQPFSTVENKKAALDNLFYANNMIHDLTYQYGFTEAAGNFQMDNLGRGGAGNDFVNADAQDANGFSNANFGTPTDGLNPRMQMYTWIGIPTFAVNSPAGIAGNYTAIESSFSSPNKLYQNGTLTGQVAWYNAASTVHTGCVAPTDPASLAGKIVLIDGTASCFFTTRVKNAQNAGAIGVLIYFTTAQGMGGTDPSVTIPTVAINASTANAIIAQLNASVPVTVSLTSGIYRDGDFDNGIITHEYGHGVSNRLTGGPTGASCLFNNEQGGEGWSDYLALMLTTNWASTPITAGPNPRPIGNYSLSQTSTGVGIRRYPYSTNMAVNPLTYADMPGSVIPHGVGEIWCSALWDMTWNIIQQVGSINPNMYNGSSPGGNSVALNLVMTGMKLQNCSPGYIDARDAILVADSILYNGTYRCAIWNAFARRGMGFSARQGSTSSTTDQFAITDLPVRVKISAPSVMQLTPSTQQVFTHQLTCDCGPVNNYVLRDTIPAGFTYISSTPSGATLSGNVLTFPAANFTASEVKNYTITLQTPAAGCAVDLSINDNREGNTTGGFVSGGNPGWSSSTVRSHTPGSSWFSASPGTATNNTLTSATTAASVVNNLSLFSFWHYYRTETSWDGGIIEYSTNGGGVWSDVAPLFLSNPYPTQMNTGSAFPNRRTYSGSGKGFNNVLLNLSSLGTTPVQIRFRSVSDNIDGVEGWYVDDIMRMNGCGGLLKTGIYNASNVVADTSFTSVFVTATPLPLRLISFDAKENNDHVALTWKTAAENNVLDFEVEWSADNATWSKIATVKALNQLTNNYNALHTDPVLGKNYYRLKMNDRDGHTTQSDVRIVNITRIADRAPVLVPNPVITEATLYISKYTKNTTVKVYDSKGSLVTSLTAKPGIQQLQINTSRLSAGIYVIEVMGEKRTTTRMVKN